MLAGSFSACSRRRRRSRLRFLIALVDVREERVSLFVGLGRRCEVALFSFVGRRGWGIVVMERWE